MLYIDVCKSDLEDLFKQYYKAEDANERALLMSKYNRLQSLTEAEFPNSECHYTDPWLWTTFWDLYKEETGFRPRHIRITATQVRSWLDSRNSSIN